MKEISRIRNLYTPLQPTIRRSNQEVTYREHLPQVDLQSFIYCYWELKTNKALTAPFTYRVVTDGCIDIFFDRMQPAENYVMGFCKKYTSFPLENRFHYIGIRFLPTAFPQLFDVNAAQLSNQFQPLQQVAANFSNLLAKHFIDQQEARQLVATLDEILMETIRHKKFNADPRLYDAIHLILKNFGVLNLQTELNTGLSQRQLRRLFNYYIGATPKSFSQVVRFQNILKAKPSTQSLRKNKLFYAMGYYDQAHFIKDFRNFYGVTPTQAFGRE